MFSVVLLENFELSTIDFVGEHFIVSFVHWNDLYTDKTTCIHHAGSKNHLSGFPRLYPDLKFSCSGNITKISFIGERRWPTKDVMKYSIASIIGTALVLGSFGWLKYSDKQN